MTSKLRWACPRQFIFGPNFGEKMTASKIKSNLKEWLFQIGWIIVNAIWFILCPYVETQNPNVNKTQYGGSGHYSGVLWDV